MDSKMTHQYAKNAGLFMLSLLCLFFLWFLFSVWLKWLNPSRFPTPYQTWEAILQIFSKPYANGRWLQHVWQSLTLVLSGFFIASSLGVLLGLLMGSSAKIEAIVNPVFLFLRPIPPLAWIPLSIVWLGLGDLAKIMVIFVAAFVPSVINTFTGVRSLPAPQREAAQMLGIHGTRYIVEVLVPSALPMIFTGLRLSLQASWTTLVAAELVGALAGLGQILNQAAQDIYPAMILVGMISVALWGGLCTALLGWIEKKSMPWKTS